MLIDYCMKDSSYVYCHEIVKHGGNHTKGPSSHGISIASLALCELKSCYQVQTMLISITYAPWVHGLMRRVVYGISSIHAGAFSVMSSCKCSSPGILTTASP